MASEKGRRCRRPTFSLSWRFIIAHYYDSITGALVAEVPNQSKGGYRPTTIKDARKLNLVPSVTTVLSLLDKPMLLDWKIEQAIRSALTGGWLGESEANIAGIKEQAEHYTKWASDFGTAVHSFICDYFTSRESPLMSPLGYEAKKVAEKATEWMILNGYVCEKPEHTFVTSLGYAGTADFIGTRHGEPVLVDFKTRDGLEEKKPAYYDEQALQLAGYAIGAEEGHRTRVSLLIDRSSSFVVTKDWTENDYWDERWLKLWEYWKVANRWQ